MATSSRSGPPAPGRAAGTHMWTPYSSHSSTAVHRQDQQPPPVVAQGAGVEQGQAGGPRSSSPVPSTMSMKTAAALVQDAPWSCHRLPIDSFPTSSGSSSSPCCRHARRTPTAADPARFPTVLASPRSCSCCARPPRGICCPTASWAAAAPRPPTAGSPPGPRGRLRPARVGPARAPGQGGPDRLAAGQRGLDQSAGPEGGHTGPNPTERGKAGSKLHLAADGGGIPLAILLTARHRLARHPRDGRAGGTHCRRPDPRR